MTTMTLAQLRDLRRKYVAQAQAENVPQALAQIALQLGEGYKSWFAKHYSVFSVYYADKLVVLSSMQETTIFVPEANQFEVLTHTSAFVMKDYDPYKIDQIQQMPIFWQGDHVLYWKSSNLDPAAVYPENVFVPGDWWEKVKEYLPQVDLEQKKSAQENQENDRQALIEELLIGKKL